MEAQADFSWQHWLAIFGLFGIALFGVTMPVFKYISLRLGGEKFQYRLGTVWDGKDPKHRRDVFYSFLSFMSALALSMWGFSLCIQIGWLAPVGKIGI